MTGSGQKLIKIIDRISYAFLALSGALIVVMMFSSVYGVVARYAFNAPEPYSYEVSTILLLWTFVFAVSAVEAAERHIRVDFITNTLSGKGQHIVLYLVAPLMGLFLAAILAWKGLDGALFSLRIDEVSISTVREPLFPVKLMVPVGYAMLFLVLLGKLYKGITGLKWSRETSQP